MTSNEISDLARQRKPLPKGLPLVHQQLYYVLRGIYRGYDAGELTVEEAKKAKTNALRQFDIEELAYRVNEETSRRRVEISRILSTCDKCDRRESCKCEQCKQIAKIYDGRQRTATLNSGAEDTDNATSE